MHAGQRVRLIHDPGRVGVLTGKTLARAGTTRWQVQFPEGSDFIPDDQLELVPDSPEHPVELLERGRVGSAADLRRTLTHVRLTGRLANVLYSMDMTGTDFYAYQFKPLVKLLQSPSTGILMADEVGLGKTIEAGLLWTELRSRFHFRRVLVLCPAVLREKWASELRTRFGVRVDTLSAARAHNLLDVALSEIAQSPQKRAEARERAIERVINDPIASRDTFEQAQRENFSGERKLVEFLEAAYDVIDGIGGDELSNRYFNLLAAFIEKFSLRYDLRRPCTLCPTLPGVFASLVRELHVLAQQDDHLRALMREFEEAVRDLRLDCSDGRIKTCIQKQVNLVEALARVCPGVTGTTLRAICEQVNTWPHEKLKAAMKDLYGFASDYPGIRHGGTPANALRPVEMRDMIAMSILLAGFTPYLSNGLNLETIYRGA